MVYMGVLEVACIRTIGCDRCLPELSNKLHASCLFVLFVYVMGPIDNLALYLTPSLVCMDSRMVQCVPADLTACAYEGIFSTVF